MHIKINIYIYSANIHVEMIKLAKFISSIMRFPNYKFNGPFYLYNKCDIIFLTVFILTHPACQLFLWEETGAPGENPRPSADR